MKYFLVIVEIDKVYFIALVERLRGGYIGFYVQCVKDDDVWIVVDRVSCLIYREYFEL